MLARDDSLVAHSGRGLPTLLDLAQFEASGPSVGDDAPVTDDLVGGPIYRGHIQRPLVTLLDLAQIEATGPSVADDAPILDAPPVISRSRK